MIEVNELTYAYPGAKRHAVNRLSFRIGKGEIFGFLGPSGAGKSTTQKILIGALQGYRGSARAFGEELSGIGRRYYERIGVAFEFPNFYDKFTAMENLALFQSFYAGPVEDPEELLAAVGLQGDAHKKVGGFSKGMRMRLNLCRALINRPDILFLDEPTSGLDPANAKRLKTIIRAKADAGTTVVLTTHNMTAAAELCDRVAFIVDGELALVDSPRALMVGGGSKRVIVEYRDGEETREAGFELSGIGDDPAFLRLLREGRIETIHTQEATLEQIFIDVTGRRLA